MTDHRGRGRPPIGPSIHIRIPIDLLNDVDEYGAQNAWTRAEAIRVLLDRALRPDQDYA